MDNGKKTSNSGFTVNPVKTGASQPQNGGIAAPSAASVSVADPLRQSSSEASPLRQSSSEASPLRQSSSPPRLAAFGEVGKASGSRRRSSGVKLPGYFDMVNITSFLSAVFFFLLVLLYPETSSDFVVNRDLFLKSIFTLAVFDAVYLTFSIRLAGTQLFFATYLKNITWAVFLTSIFYALGGVKSYFFFAYVFPIVGTGFNLDPRATLTLGAIVEMGLLLITFFDTRFPHTASYYIIAASQIIFVALFTYYLYRIIKEGIRQRFEKEEVRRKYFDMVEVDRAKTEFITVVSHRLLTPLSELRWAFEQVFETKRWTKLTEKILAQSRESVDVLIGIVRDLIHIADAEKGSILYQRLPADIGQMIETVVDELEDFIAAKSVSIEFEPRPHEFILYCDPERLRNAFLNIIDNAIKYSPKGKIAIAMTKEHGGVKVEVCDTGIGIPYQEQARVFTKFFRASNAVKLEPTATGVGLYIAKNIIEKHNGSVDFVSEPGSGTTFTVFLPSLTSAEKEQ